MAKTPDSRRPELAGGQNRGSKKGSKYDPKRGHILTPFWDPYFGVPPGLVYGSPGFWPYTTQKGSFLGPYFGSYLSPWDPYRGHSGGSKMTLFQL